MLDSRRNMRRLMELVAMFDSDQIANQRVHVFQVKNGRPSDMAKELENIVKSIALSEKNSPIKFLPIDRINTIIAVAPNPGAFTEVQNWLDKLDIPIKAAAGGIKDYVYRVHYGDANTMACSIQALYGQLSGYGALRRSANCDHGVHAIVGWAVDSASGGGCVWRRRRSAAAGSAAEGSVAEGLAAEGYGGGYGAGAGYGAGGGMYGAGGGYGAGAGYGGPFDGPGAYNPIAATSAANAAASAPANAAAARAAISLASIWATLPGGAAVRGPRVIANPMNNTLLIQATAQEYESIEQLIKELDVPPRQVLIEAKIYSVDLTYAFSSEVTAALQALGPPLRPTVVSTGISQLPTAASLMAGLTGGGATCQPPCWSERAVSSWAS